MKLNLDKEDKEELKKLEEEAKKIREIESTIDYNLLEQLEYNLNKLKEKIKNENED